MALAGQRRMAARYLWEVYIWWAAAVAARHRWAERQKRRQQNLLKTGYAAWARHAALERRLHVALRMRAKRLLRHSLSVLKRAFWRSAFWRFAFQNGFVGDLR